MGKFGEYYQALKKTINSHELFCCAMKRLFVALLALVSAALVVAQPADTTTTSLVFGEVEWNFGRIEEEGGKVILVSAFRLEVVKKVIGPGDLSLHVGASAGEIGVSCVETDNGRAEI